MLETFYTQNEDAVIKIVAALVTLGFSTITIKDANSYPSEEGLWQIVGEKG
jgi:hypothetical protein